MELRERNVFNRPRSSLLNERQGGIEQEIFVAEHINVEENSQPPSYNYLFEMQKQEFERIIIPIIRESLEREFRLRFQRIEQPRIANTRPFWFKLTKFIRIISDLVFISLVLLIIFSEKK